MSAILEEAEDNRPRLKRRIEWRSKDRNATIEVYGSWNRFEKPTVLKYERRGLFACEVHVPVGEHYYRFLVDDDWETDDTVSKTVKLGNEYNTLIAEAPDEGDEKAKKEEPQEAEAGAESIMYDSVSRSFKVGRSTQTKKKSKRSTRNRPSMEISLPAVLKITEDAEGSDDDAGEGGEKGAEKAASPAGGAADGKEKRRRDKKRKRKRRPKGKRSAKGYEFSPDVELEKAFKKKEEEWARMCFVQQLRQQQAHNDEINRVKTLWKQERQVRVEMHKKVMKAKSELETDLRNKNAELAKTKNNIALDQSADAKKVASIATENDTLNSKIKEATEARKQLEADMKEAKKKTAEEVEAAQKEAAEMKKQISEMKSQLDKAESEVSGLTLKNKNLESSIEEVRSINKKAMEEEKSRMANMSNTSKEDQEVISKLRTERNQLEADLRGKTQECTEIGDKLRASESKMDDANTQEEELRRKIKQLESDTSAAEAADKKMRQLEDEWGKEKKEFEETTDRLGEKVKALEARHTEQKSQFEEREAKFKADAEANLTAMSKTGSDSEKRIGELSAQVDKLNTDNNAKEEEISGLNAKLKEASDEASRKSKAVDELQAALDETKQQAGETTDKLSAATRDLKNVQEELGAAQETLAKNKEGSSAKMDEMQKQITSLREQNNKNEGIIVGLRSETESGKGKIGDLEGQLQKRNSEIEDFKEQLSIAQSAVKDQEINVTTLEDKLKKSEERTEQLKQDSAAEVETLSAQLKSSKEDAAASEEKSQEALSAMEAEKNAVQETFKKREAEFIDLETQLRKREADFEIEKETWGAERESLRAKVEMASEKDHKILQCCKNLFKEFEAVRASMDQVRSLKLDELERMNEFFPTFQELLNKTLDFNAKLVKDTMEKYKRELSLRRKYFNIVQELRGNIRVFCRVRPLLPPEVKKGVTTYLQFPVEEDFVIDVPSQLAPEGKFTFEYDRVYKPKSTQESISEDTSEYIQSVMDGYNVSIFAYGQTGSGKTFTMDGPFENPGVNLRALDELFRIAEERKPMFEYTITMSVFEIYNDKVRCLLHSPKEVKQGKVEFKCRLNNDGSVYVEGAREVEVNNKQDVLDTMTRAKKYRKTASTNMNESSSRSHMILVVSVRGFNVPANIEYLGKLFLVDLAGSERILKSAVKGARLKEATEINKSLTALGDVMQALQKKQKFIPFRNSTLTYLMQNALGGHAKTIMFINVSPVPTSVSETLSSLRFAQRVAKVELGKAVKTYKKIDKLNAKAAGKKGKGKGRGRGKA